MNVVVWGIGPHAIKNILPALKNTPQISLYGVCSRNPDQVAKTAREYECLAWTDASVMLQDPKVDAVFLSTPISLHFTQGREILSAGKHLWCEKPLTNNLSHAMELVRLSHEKNLTLAEGFMYLYHPQFLELREILKTGKLGSLQSVTCRFGIPPMTRSSFRSSPELGGGAFWDIGCYPLSIVPALFSDQEFETLSSTIGQSPSDPVDTSGQAVLQVKNGPYITLEWGSNCSYRNEIDIWGQKGSVSTERIFSKPVDYQPKFRFHNLQGEEKIESGHSGNHFIAMFEEFRLLGLNSSQAEQAREQERKKITARAQLRDLIYTKIHTGIYKGV